jgi:hypothetical protein
MKLLGACVAAFFFLIFLLLSEEYGKMKRYGSSWLLSQLVLDPEENSYLELPDKKAV